MTDGVPAADEVLLVGQIVGSFGVRGQVKLRAITDQIDHLATRIRRVYVGDQRRPYTLRDVQSHKPGILIATLGGIGDRDQAEALRGADVFIHEQDAVPLAEDEYFLHELIGMAVVADTGEQLGTVREVLETGANEVLVVVRPGRREILIPMIRDVLQTFDRSEKRLVVHLLPGLLDEPERE